MSRKQVRVVHEVEGNGVGVDADGGGKSLEDRGRAASLAERYCVLSGEEGRERKDE